jgi:uncharacterized phiE125 gp8 family phage protein
MAVIVITPPEPLVDLNETKQWLRVDHADDDGLIAGLIAAVQSHIDGPDGVLGRALGTQILEYGLDRFHGHHIELPCPPVISIESVTYTGQAGSDVAWAAGWRLYDAGLERWSLAPLYGGSWPSVRYDRRSVRIRYRAGYETLPAAVPLAVKRMVAHLYDNRASAPADAMKAVAAELGHLKIYRV